MVRSPGFGSTSCYYLALLRLAFASAPHFLLNLARYHNSPVHSAKGTLSPINGLELLVGTRFQVLFHSPPGVLFTFPSRYYTLSVIKSYLALGDGPPAFTPGFSCPMLLRILTGGFVFRLQGFYLLRLNLSRCIRLHSSNPFVWVLYPVHKYTVWALACSLATTEASSHLFSLPLGTKMFQFPRFPSLHYVFM